MTATPQEAFVAGAITSVIYQMDKSMQLIHAYLNDDPPWVRIRAFDHEFSITISMARKEVR